MPGFESLHNSTPPSVPMENWTLSPVPMESAVRKGLGSVICPFDVSRARIVFIPYLYGIKVRKSSAAVASRSRPLAHLPFRW
ncbi:MAG TPA: hypothetical protein PKI32_08520 [Opitutales bacterium]|nr:hypothetical protein [Opitutales bacterium]